MKKDKIIALAILCMAMMAPSATAHAQQPDRSRPQLECQQRHPRPPHRHEYNLSDEDYAVLYNKVKKASFDYKEKPLNVNLNAGFRLSL